MAQHDYNIANAGGATVRADINNVLAAIQSANSGTGAPSSTVAGMFWLDTSGGLPYALKIRDGGNNHWLTLAYITDPGSDGSLIVAAIEGTSVFSSGETGGTKFLREDGDGSCSFQSVPTNFEFISKGTASNSASIEFTSLSNYSTYKNLYFVFNNVLPASDGDYLSGVIATSGTTYLTSVYNHIAFEVYSNGSSHGSGHSNSTGGGIFRVGAVGNTQTDNNITNSDIGVSGDMMLFSPNETVKYHSASGNVIFATSSGYIDRTITVGKYFLNNSPITAIKFYFLSGNITSGSIAMYGVRDA